MSRKPREIFEGAIYHIYQRGNNRDFIFTKDKHKKFFVKQIFENVVIFDYQILAYVVMGNHYHLIIRTGKDCISNIMFNVNNVFSKYINRELNRTGHAFDGRFHAKLVDNDAYLVWLLRYIHRNPIRANMCSNLDDYRWSSHHFYKYQLTSSFINTSFILNILSSDKNMAKSQYMILVNHNESEDDKLKDFEEIKKLFNLRDDLRKFAKQSEEVKLNRKSLLEILDNQILDSEIKELLISGSMKRCITPYRINFIKECLQFKYSIKDISNILKTNEQALYKFLSRNNIDLHP